MNCKQKFAQILQKTFGYANYSNKLQEEAVAHIYEAKRNTCISGPGKSLSFMLAVLAKQNSFMVIITPRNEFTKRYVKYFSNKDIKCEYLNESTSRKKKTLIENDLTSKSSKLKMLFITPTQYESAYFKNTLQKIDKQRLLGIVLDEAGCILSKHDSLRNQYKSLDLNIVSVPIITITSTVFSKVQREIAGKLSLRNPKIFILPVLRINMYIDMRFTNTMINPVANMINFIKRKKESGWGLIINKDVDSAISIAKLLTSRGILTLAYGANENASSKNVNLENIEQAKIISICETDTISITNGLCKIITEKRVKFVIYFGVVPTISRYYTLLRKTQCSHETTFSRIYYSIEELINNHSCIDDINCGLKSEMFKNLIDIRCRHQVYSEFFGGEPLVCKKYCDSCIEQNKVQRQVLKLLEITNNANLRAKLQQVLPQCSETGVGGGDKNSSSEQPVMRSIIRSNASMGGECLEERVSSKGIKSIADVRKEHVEYETKKNAQIPCRKPESSASPVGGDKCSNNDSLNLPKSLKCDKTTKKYSKLDKKKNEAALRVERQKSNNNNCSSSDKTFMYTSQVNRITEKDKKKEALSKLNDIYTHIYASKESVEKPAMSENRKVMSKKAPHAIATDDVQLSRSNSSKKVDVDTKKTAIELVTISDDDEISEKENSFAGTKADRLKDIDETDDEITIVEEVGSSNKKRRHSAQQRSSNYEQSKRRRLT